MLCSCEVDGINAVAPANDIGATPSYEGEGPWFTCDPAGEMPPRLAEIGVASDETQPATLCELLERAADKHAEKPAMKAERPCPQLENGKAPPALPEKEWQTWCFAQYLAEAKLAGKGFMHLGLQQFDAVNVWGFNAPEWMCSAYGAAFAGGKVAGIYPTDNAETAAYKVVHSGGAIVVVEDEQKLKKLVAGLNERKDCQRLKAFVAYGYEPQEGAMVEVANTSCSTRQIPVIGWRQLIELGEKTADAEFKARTALVKPGHCAALIYTSGTTGMPKAVMVSHDNIVFVAASVLKTLRGAKVGVGAVQERMLSYLPLSHVAGMMLDIVCPVYLTARSEAAYLTTYFARVYDLKAGSLKDRLQVATPTLFLGVPLVWEKIADRIRAIGADVTGLKKTIATWAKGCGLDYAKNCQLGGSGTKPFGYGLADALVLSKIKANLGLQNLKFGMTGAAPIRADTLEYFGQLGIEINEVYGMSESCGLASVSTHHAHLWGSCGYALPGVELKAFTVSAEDLNAKTECPKALDLQGGEDCQGELCWRSRGNMMGYMAQPDLGDAHVEEIRKKTAEAIDAEGFLHSGDKGMILESGMCKITGRYKEIIIGEGGENIAPVPIEDHVKKTCDGIAEIMMVGDKRKYNVALVTLKAVGANGEVPGTDDLDAGAKRVNPAVQTISGAMEDEAWIAAVQAAISSVNSSHHCTNQAFKIQKFMILPTNFSELGNELTPTKKLKRAVVASKYAKAIDALYASSGTYVKYTEEMSP